MPYADPVAQREYQRMWMAARRAEALDGKACAFCSSTEDLQFHHFDPGAKIDHKVWSWAPAKRDAELAKCIVLCRPCHQRRHQEDRPQFCKRGHELTEANSYWKPGRTTRECRTCRKLRREGGRWLNHPEHREPPFAESSLPDSDCTKPERTT